MYKQVIFDLYGTLVDIHTDEHGDKLWSTMTDVVKAYGAYYAPSQLRDSFFALCDEQLQENSLKTSCPDIDVVKVWQKLLKVSKLKVNKTDATHCARTMRALSTDHIRLYSGALPLLTKLKKAKVPMYLLCNGQKQYVTTELRLLGIARFFKEKIISSEYGVANPNPSLFNLILRKHKLNAEDIVVVGNDLTSDIEGANATGMDSIYIDNGSVNKGKGEGIASSYGIVDGNYNKIFEIVTRPAEEVNY